jgi:hypothetical protein
MQALIIFIRCDADPKDLDAGGAHKRSHKKTDRLLNTWGSRSLWTDFGIRADVVVHL